MSLSSSCRQEGWDVSCIAYGVIAPSLILLGIFGSVGNLVVMTSSDFKGVTFYYLRALSLTDLFYLFFAIGYYIELLFVDGTKHLGGVDIIQEYYLTHIDHIFCNTFISASGFLIILLTIDRYYCICHPARPRNSVLGHI